VASLQESYNRLHQRLDAATAKDPIATSVFADPGSVVVAIRSGLVEELAGSIARRYLDRVTVDLADVKAKSSGEITKDTFLGHIKVGDWKVSVELGDLIGDLRAGAPGVSLRAPDMIDLRIPVNVLEATGSAALHFGWDSSGLAKAVCKDFALNRGLRGRVLPQTHTITGAMRLANDGARLTATPIFPERTVDLRLDLTSDSWAIVEQALRSQNTSGTCGALMKPGQVMEFLKGIAAKGVRVKLPRSIFRTVSLPASLAPRVAVNRREVSLSIQGESLRIQATTLWLSASIRVPTGPGGH
jgi:hypothetical protein